MLQFWDISAQEIKNPEMALDSGRVWKGKKGYSERTFWLKAESRVHLFSKAGSAEQENEVLIKIRGIGKQSGQSVAGMWSCVLDQ